MLRKPIFKIFKISFVKTIKDKRWNWFFGSFSTLFTGLLLAYNYFEAPSYLSSAAYFLYGIGGLFILRLVFIFFQELYKYFYKKSAESKWGEAIVKLNLCWTKVNIYRETRGIQDQEFIDILQTFCDSLKIIFDKITSSNCSVSVKMPESGKVEGDATMITICRDSSSSQTRNTKEYVSCNHNLLGNTCYAYSMNRLSKNGIKDPKRFYINNNIENSSKDYMNTSMDCYPILKRLPYKSELVHPIVRIYNEQIGVYDCHGFLCVDSNKNEVFDDNYSVAILEGVADGLYDVISEVNLTPANTIKQKGKKNES